MAPPAAKAGDHRLKYFRKNIGETNLGGKLLAKNKGNQS